MGDLKNNFHGIALTPQRSESFLKSESNLNQ